MAKSTTTYVMPPVIYVRDGGQMVELRPKRTKDGIVVYVPSAEKEAELRARYRKMRGVPGSGRSTP